METPDDRRYTGEHEWALLEDGVLTVGITDYAQDQIGEVVFVEVPSEGDSFRKGDIFGAVESTKAVSDLYCPVSGKVVEVNEALLDEPDTINSSPYAEGWIIRIVPEDAFSVGELMSGESYKTFLESAE